MLDFLIWLVIIALFILSFVGIVFPLIPSPFVLWVGFLLYHFFLSNAAFTMVFWIAMGILTILLIVSDIIANSYFVKKFGGSKWGERGAAVAVIVGSFIFPPFGILLVPFVTVLVIEKLQNRSVSEAFRASIGSLIGFLGGAFAKIVIQLIMIVWFIIDVIY